jgi:hypothetical protein
MKTLHKFELGWVVGILEGEGCFTLLRRSSGAIYPRVQVKMTDEDAVRRLKRWTGLGNVFGPWKDGSYRGRKPQWEWAVQKVEDVRTLMKMVYPFMGKRRRERIRQVRKESLSG